VFCQNSDISHTGEGLPRNPRQIADIALGLQGLFPVKGRFGGLALLGGTQSFPGRGGR
jgi:hypothetical protein